LERVETSLEHVEEAPLLVRTPLALVERPRDAVGNVLLGAVRASHGARDGLLCAESTSGAEKSCHERAGRTAMYTGRREIVGERGMKTALVRSLPL